MIESLSLTFLLLILGACAAAIWFAGIKLSYTTDIPSTRFGIGETFGGLIGNWNCLPLLRESISTCDLVLENL